MDEPRAQPSTRRLRGRSPGHVTAWRRRRLQEAGFPAPLCDSLAASAHVDLHALLQLVDRGCAPELAARILAPLDDGPS